ncbi:hypothetical protein U0C82_08730 [Fulvimarina sp. 2208YS6-2-32]|uniref:Antitoxin FitA-like ribbon-helix-helix domain-containing protein n=1 Tax=Fulvimarina uroteuthidis TaxID=3098149 RepID=A0ABU5I254_9HYPH|nr:hypothetical protein [Fulvimarina sp. 2208YS6-2-32]MDY8109227.1 hypothetical protein [Fulvimarina sp. 2208YS6-2-32]
MATLTIRNLDEAIVRNLEKGATLRGHSPAEEARYILQRAFGAYDGERGFDVKSGSESAGNLTDEQQRRADLMLSLGRKPDEPFDLKAFRTELSDPAV